MSKTIWIINQYASTPSKGMGGRHYYLSRELAKLGYSVYLIAASYNHLLREPYTLDTVCEIEKLDGFNFAWINVPPYKEAHSKKRIFNWFLFSFRLAKLPSIISEAPDAIICSSPSLISFLGAHHLAKRYKARLIFEVRDIWPLTLVKLGGVSRAHPFIQLLQWIEDRAYRKADRVVSNLQNAVEHMIQRGMDARKFSWIPNGYSKDEVSLRSPLSAVASLAIPKGKFIVGYAGTLGFANALVSLLHAAELLRNFEDIVFVLVGAGKQQAELYEFVRGRGLQNVVFIGALPKQEVHAALSLFDVCYIGWLKDDLYRYGIGANKIPEYFYSGKPILHAYSGCADPVAQHSAGLTVEAENPEVLADAILRLYKMSADEREAMGAAGREAAVKHYEYASLAKNYADILFDDEVI